MKLVSFVVCVFGVGLISALTSEETTDITETCCSSVEESAATAPTVAACAARDIPDYLDYGPGQEQVCREAMRSCCEKQFKSKTECSEGMKLASARKCNQPTSNIGKLCCEECSFGRNAGETQGERSCGSPPDGAGVSLGSFLRSEAYYKCCKVAAKEQETTTVKVTPAPTTPAPKEKCKSDSCAHHCHDSRGVVFCSCNEGFRLQADKKSCKDINECAEALDDLCTAADTVCHNTPGAFKCVPVKKRDVGHSCPPGFKRNVLNQVCDDINECQLPRPPCPKYLCENTIGAYKCGGKPGQPFEELVPGTVPRVTDPPEVEAPKNDICPPGFRAGADDECNDIDECKENSDDCQRLSQHCINTHGGFFCQDHVSRRCAPGFKVHSTTGICEDIDECEESSEVCRRTEVCVNLPGAYNCKSKISQLPRLATKVCQEGTRLKPGGKSCEDIDECREGTHLCDQFQNCINTFGAHECRCKSGFELDSTSSSCVDIDECALKLDNCGAGRRCLNVLGSFTCTRPATPSPAYEYEYYDSDEDNSTDAEPTNEVIPSKPITTSTTLRPPRPKPNWHRPTIRPNQPVTPPENSIPVLPPKPTDPTTERTSNVRPVYNPYGPRPETPGSRTDPSSINPRTEPDPTDPYGLVATDAERDVRPEPESGNPRPNTDSGQPEPRPDSPNRPQTRPDTVPTRPQPRPNTDPIQPQPRPDIEPTRPQPRPVIDPTRPQPRPNTDPTRPQTRPDINPTRPQPRPDIDPNRPQPRPDIDPIRPQPRPENPTEPTHPQPSRPDSSISTPTTNEGSNPNRRPGSRRYPGRIPSGRTSPTEITSTTTVAPGFDPNDVHCLYGFERDQYGNCVESSGMVGPNLNPDNLHCLIGFEKDYFGNCVEVKTTSTTESGFNPKDLHCQIGFERDHYGNCADINECERGQHICSSLETCVNRAGGYTCECLAGFHRADDGWCVVIPTSSTTTSTTSTTSTTESSPNAVNSSPEWPYQPYTPRPAPRGGRLHPSNCGLGFVYDALLEKCVDVDECAEHKDTCSEREDCVNFEGGFRCVCGARCRGREDHRPYVPKPRSESSNVITVGSQYGQRGAWSPRPSYSRTGSGDILTSCPWGYKLTPDKRCYDVDECAQNTSACGPQQRCENFYGGYSCQCPAGHRLSGQNQCEDIDECAHGNPCSFNSKCKNTIGAYSCECSEGFRNAPTNDKVCVDIDECVETPNVCEHACANVWGGYRCSCKRGYRLAADNRTCTDVNECEDWLVMRGSRAKLCGGECVNEQGSYRCSCPSGYRLSEDHRSCVDIDECETGEATCARSSDPGQFCLNTRGSYHCHTIDCPQGYKLEAKHRCSSIQRSCAPSDWECLQQPSSYSYNFITFVSNIYISSGSVDLFRMHGPLWVNSMVGFQLRMVRVQAGRGVTPAELRCFDMRPAVNVCTISLLCSLQGPQVVELELSMSLHQNGMFAGSTVARIVVVVSEYEF